MKIKAVSLLTSILLVTTQTHSDAATLNSVSHIHNIKVNGSQVLIGTHEGLYLYQGGVQMKKLGTENFDVMGLASSNGKIYASGHPNTGSKLPSPTGLISSINIGKSWELVSLQKTVDFHMLEVNGTDIYGADSQSGNLLYSADSGKKWANLGTNTFQDIAISPSTVKKAFAVESKKLLITENAFKTKKALKTNFEVQAVEVINSTLYVASENLLYASRDGGKKWITVSTFKDPISVISASTKIFVVVAGPKIYISNDSGKTFK